MQLQRTVIRHRMTYMDAPIGDVTQTLFASGRVLARHEAKPRRELPAVFELPNVSDAGDNR